MEKVEATTEFRGKMIRDRVKLSNGWYILKTDDGKSKEDFKVKVVYSFKPSHSMTPKHAHFAIDFYGKLCADKEKGMNVFMAIIDVWNHASLEKTLSTYGEKVQGIPGYSLEYILYCLRWILDQEDINFSGRPDEMQMQLNEICAQQKVITPKGRLGSQLAISLFCDIANGTHPVEAFLKAQLDVLPRIKKR